MTQPLAQDVQTDGAPADAPPRSAARAQPPGRPPHGGAAASRRAWVRLLIAALLALVADLGTKWLAFRYVADDPVVIHRADVLAVAREDARGVHVLVPHHPPLKVVPGALEFTLVLNPGAVFGMGPGARWFFVGFTGVALGFGLWMFARWTGPRDRLAHIGIGLLLGGGLGNLYDRLTIGVVRDFIHPLPGLRWPFGWRITGPTGEVWPYVSNVADALLLIGIGMLLVYLWQRDKAGRTPPVPAPHQPAAS